jgi:hypothetical protein
MKSKQKNIMQAEVLVKASHLHIITSQEQIDAAIRHELYHNQKQVLIYKGRPAVEAVRAIFKEFSVRKDLTNRPFRLSHRDRGIYATDAWGEVSKISPRDFCRFVSSWFSLAELTTYDGKPALVLAKELPSMMVPTFFQGRFVDATMLAPFQWID